VQLQRRLVGQLAELVDSPTPTMAATPRSTLESALMTPPAAGTSAR
jgi:hypothetical protein